MSMCPRSSDNGTHPVFAGCNLLLEALLQVKPAARQHSNRHHKNWARTTIFEYCFLSTFWKLPHWALPETCNNVRPFPATLKPTKAQHTRIIKVTISYWLWMHFEWRLPQWLLAGSLTCGTLPFGYTIREFLASVKKAWDQTCDFHAIGGLDIFASFCIDICRVCRVCKFCTVILLLYSF